MALLLAAAGLAGCSDGSGVGDTGACESPVSVELAAGQHAIVDPTATAGCVALPAAGNDSAEYLVVGYSAHGDETPSGVSGQYQLSIRSGPNAISVRDAGTLTHPQPDAAFHAHLRQRERAAAGASRTFANWLRALPRPVPPVEGSERSFKVCSTRACDAVTEVVATARYVGVHGAIYLDNSVPAGGYTDAELDSLGVLFDSRIFPLDTTAFGRESDIDGNGVVAILLTDQVNALSPDCSQNGQLVPGYFTGEDLLDGPGSNRGEVFYAIVPDPSNALCFDKSVVRRLTGPTLMHEFQHMISYNRHVLLSGGTPEDTWLNEGLSLLAEELGGRQVPAGFCINGNCLNQYAAANLRNAARYLQSPVSTYLVEPGTSAGTLAERGANWLFVRWLADQAGGDSLLGAPITRRLTGADAVQGLVRTGSANVAAAAAPFTDGASFASLLGMWHLANFAETRLGFEDGAGRLRYRSWNLRASIDAVQPGPYPLVPIVYSPAGLTRSGTLLGGSGDYARVVREPGAELLGIEFSVSNAATVMPRLAILRLR